MYEFALTGVLNANISSVFNAFTNPSMISRWWAPKNLTINQFIGHAKENADYRLVMQSEDGFQQTVTGSFHTVAYQEEISFTWRWEDTHEITKVNVKLFEKPNGNTAFELSQKGFKHKTDMQMQQYAWIDCFDKLSDLLPLANTQIHHAAERRVQAHQKHTTPLAV